MASSFDLLRALTKGDRLGLVAALKPAAYDVIPRGPLHKAAQAGIIIVGGVEDVSLNPQPLPPKEGAAVGAQLVHLLFGAALAGGNRDVAGTFMTEIDDWCGTGWPKRWPFPWPPQPEPDPRVMSEVFLGAALAVADIAVHYPAGEMQDVLAKAAEQLTDAAMVG